MDATELEKEIKPVFDKLVSDSKEELSKMIPKRFSPADVGDSPEDKVLNDKKGGFKSFGHYLNDVIKAGTDKYVPPTLRAWDDAVKKTAGYMEEGDLSQGGYLVPEEFSKNILSKSLEDSIVRPRASIQIMTSNRITFAADVDSDHSTDYFGGVTIYRTGEGAQKTAKNPTYARIALTLHKVTGLCHVTDELLEDSFLAVEADVTRKFSQAIAFVQDDDFLNGTGVNMPIGVLNAANPGLITVDAIGGQGAATIIGVSGLPILKHSLNSTVWQSPLVLVAFRSGCLPIA
jgi:HK97 family phage major capsid protein